MNLTTRLIAPRSAPAFLAALLLACALVAGRPAPALALDTDTALERIERVLDDVEQIQRIMHDRPQEMDRHRERLLKKEAELERERVRAICAEARVSPKVVEGMRARGMGWGAIARELRVDPFVVGVVIGHAGEHDYRHGRDRDDDDRFEQWRGRGKKKGWKHGMPPGQAKKHGYDD